jgi:hypothetical protein
VTFHLADITSHQDDPIRPLRPDDVWVSGFRALGLKTSHGLGTLHVHVGIDAWATWGRSMGVGLASCHWLTGDADGKAQAEHAYRQLQALGLTSKAAHIVDVEAGDITAKIYAEYVAAMSSLLGRPIITYTGDWWAAARPWLKPSLASPWLMGAPAAGYQPEYPGDDSPMWEDGYAGYAALSIMQYRVAEVAGIKVSQSAVRDPDIWADMTGVERVASQAYRDWIDDGQPWKFARPIRDVGDRLREHGYTVYYQGNEDHLKKAVPEDHTPFSATGWPGKSPYPYCMAMDIMPPASGQKSKITGQALPSLQKLGAQLRKDRLAGVDGADFVKYINWEPERNNGGPCYQDSWRPGYSRKNSTDRGHIHVSARSDVHTSTKSAGYDLVARTLGEDDDVALSAEDKAWIDARLKAVPDQILDTKYGSTPYPGRTVRATIKDLAGARDYMIGDTKAPALGGGAPLAQLKLLPTLLTAIQSGSVDVDALAAALAPVLAPLLPDDQDITSDLLRDALRGL